jgi:hypothetical protein
MEKMDPSTREIFYWRIVSVEKIRKARSMSTVVAVDLEPIGSSGFTVRDVRLPAYAGMHTTF